MSQGPIPDSYWVEPGQLLAGEYPGHWDPDQAQAKVATIVADGVRSFVDLTADGEYGLLPYAGVAAGLGARSRRMSIPDLGIPPVALMQEILDLIEAEIEAGYPVYVHCYGGIGRTGTVVGCWLRRQGLPGQEALDLIERLRRDTPDGWKPSPETSEQRRFVLDWEEPAPCRD